MLWPFSLESLFAYRSTTITLGVQPAHIFEEKLCRSDKGVLGPTSQQIDMLPVHSDLCAAPIPEPSLCARLHGGPGG